MVIVFSLYAILDDKGLNRNTLLSDIGENLYKLIMNYYYSAIKKEKF